MAEGAEGREGGRWSDQLEFDDVRQRPVPPTCWIRCERDSTEEGGDK